LPHARRALCGVISPCTGDLPFCCSGLAAAGVDLSYGPARTAVNGADCLRGGGRGAADKGSRDVCTTPAAPPPPPALPACLPHTHAHTLPRTLSLPCAYVLLLNLFILSPCSDSFFVTSGILYYVRRRVDVATAFSEGRRTR
jgi:hypothetical protein